LAFSIVLYRFSTFLNVPFYTFNAWVSIWLCAFCIIASIVDFTRVIRLTTRFVDDIFTLLLVSIFVMSALGDPFTDVGIFYFLKPDYKSPSADSEIDYKRLATGLLSIILCFGTTWLIFFLRGFKRSSFFCSNSIRSALHDFAMTLSVIIWALVKEFFFESIKVEKLKVPGTFMPSFICCDAACELNFPYACPDQTEAYGSRNWFASFTDFAGKNYVPVVAAGPAILAFVMVFVDNGVTWHLVMRSSHRLDHGPAYNYDLVLSGFFNLVNGMLGLPWVVATTLPCMIHLSALASYDQKGDIIKVQETRLTMLFAHILMAMTLFLLEWLKKLPVPVLYGVLLFLGLSYLPDIQFWNRIMLFFQQPSRYPVTPYTKYIARSRIHRFTLIQLVLFACLSALQHFPRTSVAVFFPLMVLLCIPVRLYVLPRYFEGWEMVLLDGTEDEVKEWVRMREEADMAVHSGLRLSQHGSSGSYGKGNNPYGDYHNIGHSYNYNSSHLDLSLNNSNSNLQTKENETRTSEEDDRDENDKEEKV
jgi:HCO3- transporter family